MVVIVARRRDGRARPSVRGSRRPRGGYAWGMGVAAAVRERARADVVRVVHRSSDLQDLARRVRQALVKAVPFDGACLSTLDPATLLPTRCVAENALPPDATLRLFELEAQAPDFNAFTALARSRHPAAGLGIATAGDLDRSRRQRELRRPNGFGDELRAVLRGTAGTWGALTLLRDAEHPDFTAADVRFVASLTRPLADGVRRTALLAEARATDDEDAAGLLVLGPDDEVQSANRAADAWLDELDTGDRSPDVLPTVVRAVAAQARRSVTGGRALARARVLTPSGTWAVVRGSLLGDAPDAPVAVLLEAARPAELAPLIADAYGLTERERRVTELVAQGCTTDEIGARLYVSPYTVQDHLKSIFDRTDSRSRGELVARLFFDHYAPRLGGDGA
jgi:DNA-binding CsgD family transcriptional regulator